MIQVHLLMYLCLRAVQLERAQAQVEEAALVLEVASISTQMTHQASS